MFSLSQTSVVSLSDGSPAYGEGQKFFYDPVHGNVELQDVAIKVIDTPEFQRLRYLKQLGSSYYTFPGASHNRFEHSVGVYHLAGAMVDRFSQRQPELEVSESERLAVRLAGLCHDLGHGPFSHVFDSLVIPAVTGRKWTHEDMSLEMFDVLVDDNGIDLDPDVVAMTKGMIDPEMGGQRLDTGERGFLYQIVANHHNGIDVDKWDYLARDSLNVGLKTSFDYSRLLIHSRVVDDHVCFHAKEAFTVFKLFQTRFDLFKTVYTHKSTKALEFMLADIMIEFDGARDHALTRSIDDPREYRKYTDTLLNEVEWSSDPALAKARGLVRRMRRRDLYRFADEHIVPDAVARDTPKLRPEDLAACRFDANVPVAAQDIIVHDSAINFGNKHDNPLALTRFFRKEERDQSFEIDPMKVSRCLPQQFQERIIRVYLRNCSSEEEVAEVRRRFRRVLRQKGLDKQLMNRIVARSLSTKAKRRTAKDADAALDRVMNFAKRRGFLFPGSEIYGSIGTTMDYGPLGIRLKRRIESLWWREFVDRDRRVVGVDTGLLLHPGVWEAAGHLDHFCDPITQCSSCNHLFRADKVLESFSPADAERSWPATFDGLGEAALHRLLLDHAVPCPNCGAAPVQETEAGGGAGLQLPRQFNLMFSTAVGPVSSHATTAYLRPETAQGIFAQFPNIVNSARRSLPFGVAQVGKAFRNEIRTERGLFRGREFDQMEMEWFCDDAEAGQWHGHFVDKCEAFMLGSLGLSPVAVRRRVYEGDDLAHYARATTDLEFNYPFGWGEVWGIADRGTHDLDAHAAASGIKMTAKGSNQVPTVIEPSVGLGRLFLAVLCDRLCEDRVPDSNGRLQARTVLKVPDRIAPIDLTVLPLRKKGPEAELAQELFESFVRNDLVAEYDEAGSIGKRYRRQDEIGTPVCLTVDPQSLDDRCVTLRDRDTTEQVRIAIDQLQQVVQTSKLPLREALAAAGVSAAGK